MNNILPGDLVQVVKPNPCCGNPSMLGLPFMVWAVGMMETRCKNCGLTTPIHHTASHKNGAIFFIECLKKLDDPEVGCEVLNAAQA